MFKRHDFHLYDTAKWNTTRYMFSLFRCQFFVRLYLASVSPNEKYHWKITQLEVA